MGDKTGKVNQELFLNLCSFFNMGVQSLHLLLTNEPVNVMVPTHKQNRTRRSPLTTQRWQPAVFLAVDHCLGNPNNLPPPGTQPRHLRLSLQVVGPHSTLTVVKSTVHLLWYVWLSCIASTKCSTTVSTSLSSSFWCFYNPCWHLTLTDQKTTCDVPIPSRPILQCLRLHRNRYSKQVIPTSKSINQQQQKTYRNCPT